MYSAFLADTGAVGAGTGFRIGASYNSSSQNFNGHIAAGMYSSKYVSQPEMLAWAADPWAFWYPPVRSPIMFSGLKGPSGGANTFALATTEAPDTAAFNLGLISGVALATTEAADTAAINLGANNSAALATTEAPDVGAFNLGLISDITLATTEAPDAAAFNVQQTITAALATTEAPDVAAVLLTMMNAALAVTEAPDVGALAIDAPTYWAPIAPPVSNWQIEY